jgi:Zinc finger, C2H2 type
MMRSGSKTSVVAVISYHTLNKVRLLNILMSAATAGSKTPRQHRCSICGRVFDSPDLLEAHKRIDHGTHSSPPAGVG